jgi:3-methyladenine DNA glycosylase AlkD
MVATKESTKDILAELKKQGNEGYKKTMVTHGAKEPVFGVKIEYMKKIQKRIKHDYQLAKDLFASGVYDAMYLAGLIADDKKMTKSDLQRWAKGAKSPAIGEYTVPWVAAESNHGWELALEWIDSKQEAIATSGWATLSSFVAITPDDQLDLSYLKKLLQRVEKTIHDQPNRVRYCMNNFVIACGGYVAPLTQTCIQTARKIGPVSVDMHGTACKTPAAEDYINKVKQRGSLGKKRKSCKC